jgi:O-antigen ligase
VYTVCVLVLASGAFQNLESDPQVDIKAGMPFMRALWVMIYLILVVLLFQKCRGTLRLLARQPLLWLPVLWALGSSLWSGEPELTFRRGVMLVLTTLFGAYVGSRFPRSEFLRLLAIVCGIVAVCSLVFGLLGLGTPVDNTPGWYGIFVQKNVLGRIMAFAVLLFLIASRAQSSGPVVLRGGLILCALLLALSKSVTGLAVTALAILFLMVAPVLRKSLWRLTLGLLALGSLGVFALFWVISNLNTVTDLIGRDITMTGRLKLWVVSFMMALPHLWLGYGYYAFWLGLDGPSRYVWMLVHWHAPHPHNGLLSVWLDLGLIGVALVALAYFVYLTRAVRLYRRTDAPEAIWPLLYFVFFLLANLTESSVLTANGIFWMLFVAAGISLGQPEQRNAVRFLDAEILS